MAKITVRTQAELDLALKQADAEVHIEAKGRFIVAATVGWLRLTMTADCHVVAWGSSHVEAWGSSHVVAWGSSHVVAWESSHVVAWGSSHVEAWGSSHVEAWESSHVEAWESSHVEAWGSSHVEAWESSHVVARGSSHVVARGSSHVEAWGHVMLRLFSALKVVAAAQVVIVKHGTAKELTGGHVIDMPAPQTPQEWCDHYGVDVKEGVAILFKGVGDDLISPRGGNYTPGTVPVAPDWDGGKKECGGGFHFSPDPRMTLEFNRGATRFIACPVALTDICVHPNGDYPQKVKARGCCAPVYEVDRYGKPMPAKDSAA